MLGVHLAYVVYAPNMLTQAIDDSSLQTYALYINSVLIMYL